MTQLYKPCFFHSIPVYEILYFPHCYTSIHFPTLDIDTAIDISQCIFCVRYIQMYIFECYDRSLAF